MENISSDFYWFLREKERPLVVRVEHFEVNLGFKVRYRSFGIRTSVQEAFLCRASA